MQYDANGKFHFSEREKKLVALVAEGMKNDEIARQIGTTYHMTKNMLQAIYDVLGFSNRVELAMWYMKREHDGEIKSWL